VLDKALSACADATGWVFFVSAGGPTPKAGGDVYMQKYVGFVGLLSAEIDML
jgi:hypothetical protein